MNILVKLATVCLLILILLLLAGCTTAGDAPQYVQGQGWVCPPGQRYGILDTGKDWCVR